MADFLTAYKNTKSLEGVNSKHVYAILPNDKGGETYGGIARVYNPSWPGWKIIDAEKKKYKTGRIPNNTHIPAMEKYVQDYYYQVIWINKAKADKIKNQELANLVFDMCFMHGKGPQVINQGIKNAGFAVKVQNKIASDTLNYLNSVPEKVYPEILAARYAYIKTLADYKHFKNGWTNRINKFPKIITVAAAVGGGIVLLIAAVFF